MKRILTKEEALLLVEAGLEYEQEYLTMWIILPIDPYEIKDFEQIMLKWGNKEEGEEDKLGDLLAELYGVEVV